MSNLAFFLCALAVAGPPPALQRLEVQSVEVSEISTDRVRLRILLGGTAERDIAIRTVTFDQASLNGVPLFVSPMSGPMRFSKGMRFADAGGLEANVFYRDLPSLEPLRRMVREEKAVVRATIRLQPELSLIQRIALRTSNASVSWSVERTVKVQVPGGLPGKTAAELGLAAADAVWVVGQRGLQWRRDRDAFTQELRRKYDARVLPVETRYTLLTKDGNRSTFVWRGLGFHAGEGHVLVAAEAVEPWMFDGAVAEGLATGAVEVIPESLDVKVGAYSLRNGSLSISAIGRDNGKGLSIERRKTFALRSRDSMRNVARLAIPALKDTEVTEVSETGDVAVFRLREDGGTELLMVSAAIENGRLQLQEPVDSRAYGSPVIHAKGVLGLVVSQTAVAPLRETR